MDKTISEHTKGGTSMAENRDYMTKELENGTVNINEDVLLTVAATFLLLIIVLVLFDRYGHFFRDTAPGAKTKTQGHKQTGQTQSQN